MRRRERGERKGEGGRGRKEKVSMREGGGKREERRVGAAAGSEDVSAAVSLGERGGREGRR